MKKIIAVVMALVMVLTFASCGSSKSERDAISAKIDALAQKLEEVKQAVQTAGNGGADIGGGDDVGGEDVGGEDIGDEPFEDDVTGEAITDNSGEAVTNSEGETQTAAPKTTKSTTKSGSTSASNSNDPSKWTAAQIVDYYKKAANISKQKSSQTMNLQEIHGILSPLKGIINKALQNNSAPFDGITGGYKSLVASDLTAANAKASGNYVIINMNAKEQIDGAYGKSTEGTVGHLVSVLDGVATAVDALGVPAEYPEGSVKLDYKNAFAKNIKINTKTGQIESGEWGYDLYITLNGAKLSVITIKNVNALLIYRVQYPAK